MKILSLFVLIFSNLLFAGGSSAGGNVVICGNANAGIQTFEVLDYYEARVLFKSLKLDLGTGSEFEKVKYVIDRLAKVDRKRADEYQKQADSFLANANFVSKVNIPPVNDYGYVPIGIDCTIEQIAYQRKTPFPEAKLYVIKKEYWDKLDSTERAGLILHEIIYHEALKLGHKDSINVRYMNALISSKNFESMSVADYQERMEKIGMQVGQKEIPIKWVMNPIQLPDAFVGEKYSVDLNKFVSSVNKYQIQAVATGEVSKWLMYTSSGELVGTPQAGQEGKFEIELMLMDAYNKPYDKTRAFINVKNKSSFPSLPKEITLPAFELGKQIQYDFSKNISNIGKSTCTFFSKDLPDWAGMSGLGVMTGTPNKGGNFKFSLEVSCHGGGYSLTILNSNVVGTVRENISSEISCELVAIPSVVKLGQKVKLLLTIKGNGEYEHLTINGQKATSQSLLEWFLEEVPTMEGKFTAIGFVKNKLAARTCAATYTVKDKKISSLPEKFDLRTHLKGINPIKNQGKCGSGWAFAQSNALETAIKMQEGLDVLLSEQHLISCNTEGYSCRAGFGLSNRLYIDFGAVLEQDFKYVGADTKCKKNLLPYRKATKLVELGNEFKRPLVDDIRNAIVTKGSVIASIKADPEFLSYKSGVLNCTESQKNTGAVNHMVNIVGWDDEEGYWIVRNSWGENYGEKGYTRIQYGCKNIAQYAAYYEYEKPQDVTFKR